MKADILPCCLEQLSQLQLRQPNNAILGALEERRAAIFGGIEHNIFGKPILARIFALSTCKNVGVIE